jgi:LDH2 family malate/lactate/ureidoglycolate dehydrogenase
VTSVPPWFDCSFAADFSGECRCAGSEPEEARIIADHLIEANLRGHDNTASPPARPDEPVLIPGDPERRTRAERMANGVPIDDETWRELTVAARGINVLVEALQSKPG